MKVAHKIALISAIIILLVISVLSWTQYVTVRDSLYQKAENNINETSSALGFQVANWLNGKLHLIDLVAQDIDSSFSPERIQDAFDQPIRLGHSRR